MSVNPKGSSNYFDQFTVGVAAADITLPGPGDGRVPAYIEVWRPTGDTGIISLNTRITATTTASDGMLPVIDGDLRITLFTHKITISAISTLADKLLNVLAAY